MPGRPRPLLGEEPFEGRLLGGGGKDESTMAHFIMPWVFIGTFECLFL